jgi:hypothetical protein
MSQRIEFATKMKGLFVRARLMMPLQSSLRSSSVAPRQLQDPLKSGLGPASISNRSAPSLALGYLP